MGYIICNIDKKEYLLPAQFGEGDKLQDIIDSYQGVMLGLTLLLADGNGRGGGDLRGARATSGSWAGDHIIIADESVPVPEGFHPSIHEQSLQSYMLEHGTNVSNDVIGALLGSTGNDIRLSELNPASVIPLSRQSQLIDSGAGVLLTEEGRASRLSYTDELFGAFGQALPLSTNPRKRVLEQGINQMAKLLGRPERYTVQSYTAEVGAKRVLPRGYNADSRRWESTTGDQKITVNLLDQAGQKLTLEVFLGADIGTKVGQVYDRLFPAIEFNRSVSEFAELSKTSAIMQYLNGMEA